MDILTSAEGFQALVDGQSYRLRVLEADDGMLLFEVDGRQQRVYWAKAGRRIWLQVNGRSNEIEKSARSATGGAAGQTGESILRAPMPGQVRQLMVTSGDQVELGGLLLLLEAMKMEIRIQAPRAGKVTSVAVAAGDSVEKDQILVELDSEDD